MARKQIVLIGGGGFCRVVIDALSASRQFSVYGIVDEAMKGMSVMGIKVVGNDSDLPVIYKKGVRAAFICIGTLFNNENRKKIYKYIKGIGFSVPYITHTRSIIANDVNIGEGSYVAAAAVINTGSKIGKNVIINTHASIDHDCNIGDYVQVAPGAVLCGNVMVGNESHIGPGATVIQNISIGRNVILGAGSVAVKNIKDGIKALGVPAVKISKR